MSYLRIKGLNDLRKLLSAKQKVLKNYRIVFINTTRRELERAGLLIREQARLRLKENGYGLDTGTLRSRVDFKVLQWNQLRVGIYENAAHPPTANISKYTGKVRKSSEKYAKMVHQNHPKVKGFLQQEFDKYATKQVGEHIKRFMDQYGKKIR